MAQRRTPAPSGQDRSLPERTSAASRPAEWPAQAADMIESVVTTVRDRSVVPLQAIARAVVYGLLALIVASVLVVLAAIAVVRALVVYVPPHRVWLADVVLGGVFALMGIILWSQRRPRRARAR